MGGNKMKQTLFNVTFADGYIFPIKAMSPLRASILASAERIEKCECFDVDTVTNTETGISYKIFLEIKVKK